jgi:hypothetical protein
MPQFAVLIYAEDSAHAPTATKEQLRECDDDYEALRASGRMRLAYALTPRDLAVTVTADGRTDGTHLNGAHIVAGFYVLEAADIEEAARLARNNPAVLTGGAVEIRPVHSGGVVEPN